MERHTFKQHWHNIKGKIQAKWNRLTEDDMDEISGDLERLLMKLEEHYDMDRERACRELESLCNSCGCGKEKGRSSQEGHHYPENKNRNQNGRDHNDKFHGDDRRRKTG